VKFSGTSRQFQPLACADSRIFTCDAAKTGAKRAASSALDRCAVSWEFAVSTPNGRPILN